jgi:outer membrane protein OmpA-like peptidoglycan-associated protein
MAEDWAIDVKKYVPDADDKVIAKIVSYCGIALRKRDSSLVSFTDPKETGRVRDNYCRKKLGLTESDAEVDAAIAAVGKRMKGDSTRNRVTVYYLLAEAYGKLGLFGGAAAAAAPVVAVPVAAKPVVATPVAAEPVVATPVAASAGAAGAAAALMSSTPAAASIDDAEPVAAAHVAASGSGSSGMGGTIFAVLGGILLIMLIGAVIGSLYGSGRNTNRQPELPAYAGTPSTTAPAASSAAPVAIPEGSGVTAQVLDGMPKVSVYFDTGKTAIAPDFATVAAPVKAWIDANPADRLAVSGFNDPTGNAAANAELSKNRAKAVAAALAGIGIAAERIDLVKPPATTATDIDLSQARRVEIVVTPGG